MRCTPLLTAVALLICASVRPTAALTPSPVFVSLLLALFLPWFQAVPAHEQWGWHWTMNHYHPQHIVNGQNEAASHYHPLMGLYDSGDPDAVECHALLMKFAGIDGVLIDWYGMTDYLDYGLNHRNTLQMIAAVKKAGLK